MRNDEIAELFSLAATLFKEGRNVVQGLTKNNEQRRGLAIEIAYSLQSGEYTRFAATEIAKATRNEGHKIVEPILRENEVQSILDCGAGEGTRWLDFRHPTQMLYCLDASYHRLVYCRRNISSLDAVASATFIKANMVDLPFNEGSVDAVFTCHAIEPNADDDAERIIRRIFATAGKLVVIMEPNYCDAAPEMKERMKRHGYARNIWDVALSQPGFDLVAEGSLVNSPNPLNRTSYLIFRRADPVRPPASVLCSPIDRSRLVRRDGMFLEEGRCFGFPILGGIHCLAPEDGVFVGCDPDSLGTA